ncbi:thioredoxin family protein [Leucobacter ruminantium]|uniref:Thioredoxin family protein n=1 Tax=Leucobacter ruminantium TaxID=1289170 RepID=A0A939LX19_9MICO|nr:thioredoxin family protein [Leucobacter ruminantium]MBO1804508.1 thioredoxin family protein [Leucobacter ruminantium]
MTTFTLTAASFTETVTARGAIVVCAASPDEEASRSFAPVYAQVAATHPGLPFGTIDITAEPDLAARLTATTVPLVLVYRDGLRVFSRLGPIPEAELEQMITDAQQLDMEAYRASLQGLTAD